MLLKRAKRSEPEPCEVRKIKKLLILFYAVVLLIGFPNITVEPANARILLMSPKQFASHQLPAYGWGKNQMKCLIRLWNYESHWNPLAFNSTPVYWKVNGKRIAFHARGIAQKLGETSHDPHTQINNGLRYIRYRYGSPCEAYAFWNYQAQRGTGWY